MHFQWNAIEHHVFTVPFSSANATPAFEGKGGDDLGTEISNVLSMAYETPDVFDLRQLCIIPHKKCWKMYVDILVRGQLAGSRTLLKTSISNVLLLSFRSFSAVGIYSMRWVLR